MFQQIRFKTFETNSSTTHNMVIIPDEDIKAWDDNELFYGRWVSEELIKENNGSRLFTKEFLKNHGYNVDEPNEDDYENYSDFEDAHDKWEYSMADFINSEQWDSHELECDVNTYTTKHGDKIHILCEYGYDG